MTGVVAGFMAKLGGNEVTWGDPVHETLAVYNRKHCDVFGRPPNALCFGRQSRLAILDLALEGDVGYPMDYP